MQLIKYPNPADFEFITKRPQKKSDELYEVVNKVLDDVRKRGDDAVKEYELKFDKTEVKNLQVTKQEIDAAESLIPENLKNAISDAYKNIRTFHEAQVFKSLKVETAKGVVCWQKAVPVEKVGLYIPGGTAPLFSTVLMLATPAKIAGCREIILCTPPAKDGTVNPAILFAAKIAGVDRIFKIGGVQAIGAMAYGTETVPKVFKIFGPGNQYVMTAKQVVSLYDVAIDMPAGPSEVAVVADKNSNPEFVAADLLSQAEHGYDSQVILVVTDESIIPQILTELEQQLDCLPRKEMAKASLDNSKCILVENIEQAMRIINVYAPEHLILNVKDYVKAANMVVNAGSVFLGQYSCESAGDYASGTNHTLPTNGYSTAYSGVSLDSFCKKITFQELSKEGVRSIAQTVEIMANAEQLNAHESAMKLRRLSVTDTI